MSNKLKPCPFCGSEDVKVKCLMSSYYVAQCWEYSCGAIGPIGRTEQEAIEAWNRRAGED